MCTECKKRLRLPGDAEAGKTFKCPNCGAKQVVMGAEAEKRDSSALKAQPKPPKLPRKDIPPERKGELLLELCPVCGSGQVFQDKLHEEGQEFICDACDSVLSETIFGFVYQKIDDRFAEAREKLANQTFTKLDLVGLVARMKAEFEQKEPPTALPPSQEKTAAPAAPPSAEATQRPAEGASPPPPAEPPIEELWWEVDEEAMAARRKEESQRKTGAVTVDDLLEELGKEEKSS